MLGELILKVTTGDENLDEKTETSIIGSPKLVQISKTEFDLLISKSLTNITDAMASMDDELTKIVRTYNMVTMLENSGEYRVRYYQDDLGNISYKTEKRRVGFYENDIEGGDEA